MLAIAFDMVVEKLDQHHPKSVSQAYTDIRLVLKPHGFENIQGSVYINRAAEDHFAVILNVVRDLRALPWFGKCVRDIRVFRAEQWSDITNQFS